MKKRRDALGYWLVTPSSLLHETDVNNEQINLLTTRSKVTLGILLQYFSGKTPSIFPKKTEVGGYAKQ